MSRSLSFRKVYGAATVIAVITFGGLLFALFGDGIWDELSWLALAVPLAVLIWKITGKKNHAHVE